MIDLHPAARAGGLVVSCICLPASALAQTDVDVPADFATIQEGIDAACAAGGGTVWVAPGVYTPDLVAVTCSDVRLIGDIDDPGTTVIDGTSACVPIAFMPYLQVGPAPTGPDGVPGVPTVPPVLVPVNGPVYDVEVAGFTILGDAEGGHCPVDANLSTPKEGIGLTWTMDAWVHDNEIVGFIHAIHAANSDGALIAHNRTTTTAGPFTRGVFISAWSAVLDTKPYSADAAIHHNDADGCTRCFELRNTTGLELVANRATPADGGRAYQLWAISDGFVALNVAKGGGVGYTLANVSESLFLFNHAMCSEVGAQFADFGFDWFRGPTDHLLFLANRTWGVDEPLLDDDGYESTNVVHIGDRSRPWRWCD